MNAKTMIRAVVSLLTLTALNANASKDACKAGYGDDKSSQASHGMRWTRPKVTEQNVFTKAIVDLTARRAEYEAKALPLLTQLAKGAADWRPVDPILVSKIEELVEPFRRGGVDELNSAAYEAPRKIRDLLLASPDFGAKADGRYVRSIIHEAKGLEYSSFNMLHLLTKLRNVLIPTAPSLSEVLAVLQEIIGDITTVNLSIAKLEEFEVDPIFKSARSSGDLVDLRIQVERETSNLIPQSLINQLFGLATEYRLARIGRSESLTPGMIAAQAKLEELLKSNPFFRDATEEKLHRFRSDWKKATSLQVAWHALKDFVSKTDTEAKQGEIMKIIEAQQALLLAQ